jgi:hypothetical protein
MSRLGGPQPGDREGRIVKPLAVFVLIVVGFVLLAAALGFAGGSGTSPADGQSIQGQSPPQFQPDALLTTPDPESGEITIPEGDNARILIDAQHDNEFSRAEIEPIIEALFAAGHTVAYADSSSGIDYSEGLRRYDALLVIQPTDPFTEAERNAVGNFTDDGGRVVVLAEPTQVRAGGSFSLPSAVSFGADNLTAQYGIQIGAEQLYNVDDSANDNNFKSIYAAPSSAVDLTAGVEIITFDTAGYLVRSPASDAETLFTAVAGTRGLTSRRTGTYPTVARSGNLAVVADASFVKASEVYDADNEVFVGNLLAFLVGGEVAVDSLPDSEPADDETATSTPTPTPTPTTE